MKSYIFHATVREEEDKRWSAWIDVLPGCAAWGYTKEEALEALHDAVELYIEDMVEAGEELPKRGVQVVEAPVVDIRHSTLCIPRCPTPPLSRSLHAHCRPSTDSALDLKCLAVLL